MLLQAILYLNLFSCRINAVLKLDIETTMNNQTEAFSYQKGNTGQSFHLRQKDEAAFRGLSADCRPAGSPFPSFRTLDGGCAGGDTQTWSASSTTCRSPNTTTFLLWGLTTAPPHCPHLIVIIMPLQLSTTFRPRLFKTVHVALWGNTHGPPPTSIIRAPNLETAGPSACECRPGSAGLRPVWARPSAFVSTGLQPVWVQAFALCECWSSACVSAGLRLVWVLAFGLCECRPSDYSLSNLCNIYKIGWLVWHTWV